MYIYFLLIAYLLILHRLRPIVSTPAVGHKMAQEQGQKVIYERWLTLGVCGCLTSLIKLIKRRAAAASEFASASFPIWDIRRA